MRHWSKTEKTIAALCLIFVLFTGGYFLGQNTWKPAYTVQVSGLEPDTADALEAEEEPDAAGQPQESDAASSGLIDINTATAEELTELPGIGAVRAAAIVAYREQHGSFRIVEELTEVSGIGEGILAQIMDRITVGD